MHKVMRKEESRKVRRRERHDDRTNAGWSGKRTGGKRGGE